MKKAIFILFIAVFILIGCGKNKPEAHMELLVDKMQDGYVSDWTRIVAIDPPPPEPFKFRGGTPIDFSWVPTPQTGRAAEVEVDFFVSMGTVGKVKFTRTGSALGIATSTSRIESALNSWLFSNNASGEVILLLNFGKREAEFEFSKMQVMNGVDFHLQSFNSAFLNGQPKW